jgi:hypothetical protein
VHLSPEQAEDRQITSAESVHLQRTFIALLSRRQCRKIYLIKIRVLRGDRHHGLHPAGTAAEAEGVQVFRYVGGGAQG